MGLHAAVSQDHLTDLDTKMARNHRALDLEKKEYRPFLP
jgi:hypothetical protein